MVTWPTAMGLWQTAYHSGSVWHKKLLTPLQGAQAAKGEREESGPMISNDVSSFQ
jgi:hypothetical protein